MTASACIDSKLKTVEKHATDIRRRSGLFNLLLIVNRGMFFTPEFRVRSTCNYEIQTDQTKQNEPNAEMI